MNNVEKLLLKYANYEFQEPAYGTSEFKNFCTKLKNAMRRDINKNFPNLEISVWTKGYFEVSGFITRKTDGAIFYFYIADVRYNDMLKDQQLYRAARHLNDCLGGRNRYCATGEILKMIATEHNEFIGC